MTDRTRIKVAAATTALFLAGISGLGLATHHPINAASAPPAATVASPPAAAPATRTAQPLRGEGEEADGHDD